MFDENDKYVAVASNTQIVVYSLQQHNFGNREIFEIDDDKYRQILDFQLDSAGMPPDKFKLIVALQVNGITSVEVTDLVDKFHKRFIISHSRQTPSDQLKVKISRDGKQAIFSNGIEHYIHNGSSQSNFPWIKDKFLRIAVPDEEGFFIACSKDYDRDIDILHSNFEEFSSSVDKALEPDLFQAYDMAIVEHKEKGKTKKLLEILCRVGDYLSLEIIDVEMAKVEET